MINSLVPRPNRQEPDSIRTMFNAIAPTYDLLNHLISFGMDIRWRKKAISLLTGIKGGMLLDIASGSGDLTLEALDREPDCIVATDFAINMLTVMQSKVRPVENSEKIAFSCNDAHHLPFRPNSFDAVMVSFGIRNFSDRLGSLREMHRVLKPGGKVVILELTEPLTPFFSFLYRSYARLVLPLVGKMISRHNSAYRYLPESISNFTKRQEFLELLGSAGFENNRAVILSFGAATIFHANKKSGLK